MWRLQLPVRESPEAEAEDAEMHKVLLPIDGSDRAKRATDFAVTRLKSLQPTPEIRALAMHRDFILADLRRSAEEDLAEPRQRLDAAGIPCKERLEFGEVAQSIVQVAEEEGCEQIIMGTHGRGAMAGLLLGSVATKVLHLTDVPVTFVK
jgi:nucleotide-binding universal stress UspA family protein